MGNRLRNTVTLLAFTAFSTAALADDPPARVGRVALAEGQVSISQDTGQPAAGAQVNWPVTSHNTITTAPGARTELRIGSTSVRLDGGSALEVTDLDDDNLRLRLHYGRASVRIVNADVLQGFELVTPQVRVRLQQPGRVRVDAEGQDDTSVVAVFDGQALVEGGGSELTLRAGRRAEVRDDDIRTAQAQRDAFDDWSSARDQYEDQSQSTRYIASEVTGYEDLDRYGSWRTDAEYGSLWIPTTVGADWVPYRDGSWTWIEPWGWTWVDNAPWGYAPFHYGRWVYVNRRWCWTPGRIDRRPIWAPALVGWVGGGWNTTFHGRDKRPLPATGWYPLGPHDRYVPGHHAPEAHLRWWNRNVHDDGRRERNYRPNGVTVVPHDAFGHRDRVDVRQAPKGAPPPLAANQGPGSAPPPPPRERGERDGRDGRDGRRSDWRDRAGHDRPGHDRDGRGAQVPVLTAPSMPANPAQGRAPATAATPPVQAAPAVGAAVPSYGGPHGREGRQGREAYEDGRRRRALETDGFPLQRPNTPAVAGTSIASPPMPANTPPAGTTIASPPMPAHVPPAGTTIASPPMPAGTPAAGTTIASPPMPRGVPAAGTNFGAVPGTQPQQERFVPRFERSRRADGDFERRGRESSPMPPQAVAAPPAQARAPMSVAQPAPPPSVAAPAPAAAPAAPPPQHGGDRSERREQRFGRDGKMRQQEP
jgi:hypothetical protein